MRIPPLVLFLGVATMACGGSPPAPSAAPQATPAATETPIASPPVARRPAYPPTPKRPETIRAGAAGASFQDDYAWLRHPNDPEVTKWIDAQNDYTTATLRAYPHLDDLRARFQDLTRRAKSSLTHIQSSPSGFFALRRALSAPQPALVAVASLDQPETGRTVLDPAVLDPTGQTAIDWFSLSRNGKKVAVSLSKNGSEVGSLSVFDAATGKQIDGPIPRVQLPGAAGSAAFSADGKTLFYTRYPAAGEQSEFEMSFHQQVFRHVIGTPLERDERVPLALPHLAEIKLHRATRDGTIVVRVHVGDGGDRIWFVGRPTAKGYTWTQLADVADAVAEVEASRDALFVLSRKGDMRGAIVRLPIRATRLADGKEIVPASERELTDLAVTGDSLVAFDIARGNSRARAFDLSGKLRGDVHLPERATVKPEAAAENGALYVSVESYTSPPSIQKLGPRALDLQKTAMFAEEAARFDDVEILDETATSRDGTRVPITILAVRGTPRSPETPLLLTGYGGYGYGRTPSFDARRRVWLDQGGIWASAHIRGGNENGEAWHAAGKLARKQNVFDDFFACADRLISAGYTSSRKLGMAGSSNGGLLMGAALTQRPDLARAVIVGVPILDMMRFETIPNGVYNTTEFGSIDDPEVAPALLAYSPYQNAKPAAYPAVFLLSGTHDGRVNPADARTFAAKLQSMSTSEHPVLLRTWSDSGHGIGANVFKRAEESAQTYAFLLRQLDVPYRAAASQ